MEDNYYQLPISHERVTVRLRYFRECEAMLAHYLARGLSAADELSGEIARLVPILDKGIENCESLSIADLHHLHHLLAEAIRPALPSTIELLHWDARKWKRLHGIAPVPAIRWLLVFTAVFFAIMYGSVLASGQLVAGSDRPFISEIFSKPLLHITGRELLFVTGFYAGLAGLGACFSVLYDARRYIIEGTYDPRYGSNYIIRIALGIVAGLILSQLISDSQLVAAGAGGGTAQDPELQRLPYGKPIIALLGGFASQFVYKGLNKMVDAMSSLFEPNRQDEIETRTRQNRLELEQSNITATIDRVSETARVFTEIVNNPNKLKSPATLGELLKVTTKQAPAAGVAQNPLGTVLAQTSGILEKASAALAAGKLFATVMPEGRVSKVLKQASELQTTVDTIRSLADGGATGSATEKLLALSRNFAEVDPTRKVLQTAVSALGRVSGVAAMAGSGGAPGLALALVIGSAKLGGIAYDRWKARILAADFTQELVPPDAISSGAIRSVLTALPDLAGPLKTILLDNPAALNEFGRLALSRQDSALYGTYGNTFGGSATAFSDVMDHFRMLMVGEVLMQEDLSGPIAEAGVADARELFDLFDAAREDPEALAAMDELFLAATKSKEEPEALQGLMNGLRSLQDEQAA